MQQWEYTTHQESLPFVKSRLAQYGSEGWELVNVVCTVGTGSGAGFIAFYKRPLVEVLKPPTTYPSYQKWIVHHDDDCEEELVDGFCPKCKVHPDMQSKSLRLNPNYDPSYLGV